MHAADRLAALPPSELNQSILRTIEEQKRIILLNVIRRVIANPQNAETVAAAIARDWDPTINIRSDGSFEVCVKTDKTA